MSVIVIDSIAGMVPQEELEKGLEDKSMALLARLMSRATTRLKGLVRKTKTLLIFTNQFRVVQMQPFVLEGGTGGNALKYFASVRLDIKKQDLIKATSSINSQVIGQITKAKVIKNSFFPPYRTCQFYIIFGQGIDKESEMLDIGLETGEIERSGSFYKFNGTQLAQGRLNAVQELRNLDPKVYKEFEKKCKEFLFGS